MNKDIIKLESVSLSDDDIRRLLHNRINIIPYTDLACVHNIETILKPYGACVILYLTKENYGHWTCLFKADSNLLEFFDSYGTEIDDELDFIENEFKKMSKQNYPHLTSLLYECPYQISYNHYPLQKKDKNIKTCGRHIVTRLLMKDLSLDDYIDFITSYNFDPDYMVTYITNNLS
jgi:hypothetical protein